MNIYLDFDGTVVEHAYPKMGRCNFGCIEVIKKLQDAGHKIILNTYRSECNDDSLNEALNLLNEKYYMLLKDKKEREDFEMKPITEYCKSKIHPHRFNWEDIKKNNEIFIDDIAQGIPLKKAIMTSGNMVDWDRLDHEFELNNIYDNIAL